MNIKKYLIYLLGLSVFTNLSVFAADNSFFFSLGGGLEEREFDKNGSSKRLSQGGANLLFDLGYRFEKLELLVHSSVSGGYVEKLTFQANNENINGKFWYGTASVGPIIKYHFKNHPDKKWNFFVMAGPLYQWTEFSSDKASSSQNNYGDDLEVQYHGMGGIAGVGFSRNTGGSVVDRMFYQLTYKQVDYKRVDNDWKLNGIDGGSKGKSGDFTDRAVAFNVGMTFSDKLFTQIGKASKKVAKVFKE